MTDKTAAVLAVHMYGHPVDAQALRELARDRGALLLEDAAEAHGAEVRIDDGWVRCGGVGDLSVFSFYANKAITTGEGGMVLAADSHIAERIRSLKNLCFKPERRFEHDEMGHNFRMTNLQAALGLTQVARIDEIVARKRRLAKSYRERLASVEGVTQQHSAAWARPVPWMIGVVLDPAVKFDAVELARRLDAQGIDSRPYFLGMHEQPVFRKRGLFLGEPYPVAERLSRRGLYLPSSPTLDDDSVARVCAAVESALKGRATAIPVSKAGETPRSEAGVPFGSSYASAYDAFYAEKDYRGEVDALETIFARFGADRVGRVLDLGCGTGRHLELLLERGYEAAGVDRSVAMLQRARKRISRFPGAELVESSIASLRIPGKQWDAAVMMFAVLSYHTSEEEILGALRAAREHLRPGALFVADVWYGPAVLASPPAARTTSIGDESEGWIRHVDSDHDPARQLVAVQYRLERLEDGKPHAESRERHVMRYLFPREIAILLELSGFRLVHLGDWPALDAPPGSSGYAACLVARAF